MKTVLILLSPLIVGTTDRQDILIADGPSAATYGIGGLAWEPAVNVRPTVTQELFAPEMTGVVQVATSTFTIDLKAIRKNAAGVAINARRGLYWKGCPVKIWSCDDLDYAGRKAEFTGIIDTPEQDLDRYTLKVSATGSTALMDVPVLSKTFGGSGGIDGEAAKRGVPLPAAWGAMNYCQIVWIDSTYNIGMVDGYGNTLALTRCLEGGSTLGPAVADYPDYDTLKARLIDGTVPRGRWATCIAQGLIGLGAPPEKPITVDGLFGGGISGAWIKRLLQVHAGISADLIDMASIDQLDVSVPRPTAFQLVAQRKVLDLVQAIAGAANASPIITPDGRIAVPRAVGTISNGTISRTGQFAPRPLNWKSGEVLAPWSQLRARTRRPGIVLDLSDILYTSTLVDRGDYNGVTVYRNGDIVWMPDKSSWLYQNGTPSAGHVPPVGTGGDAWWAPLSGSVSAQYLRYADGTTLEGFKGSISQAVTDAANEAASALSTLALIADDNVLSRGEKPAVIQDWNAIDNEKVILEVLADTLGVSRTAYDAAYAALSAYLGGLNPGWSDLSQDTPIVGTTFRQKFVDYYNAKISLLRATDEKSATLANWSAITDDNGARAALILQALNASNDAQSALTALGIIANDGILSRGEKPAVIQDWNAIAAELTPIQNQANALGVDPTAFQTAYGALGNYLSTIGPTPPYDWSNTGVDSPIDPVAFRNAFTNYYTAKVNLLNAIAQAANNAGAAPNELPLSNFAQHMRGFIPGNDVDITVQSISTASGAGSGVNYPIHVGLNLDGWYGTRNVMWATAAGTFNAGEFIDMFATYSPFYVAGQGLPNFAATQPYMMKIKAGDRLYARCSLAKHRCDVQLLMLFFNGAGNLYNAAAWAGARELGGQNGDPANMNVVGGIVNVDDYATGGNAPAFAALAWRAFGNGGNEAYIFMTEPAMGHLTRGQTALPPYVDGPGDPVADVTSQNTALDTQKLAGRDAATVKQQVDDANNLAATAESFAVAAKAITDDIADNNHASPDEKKRYVAIIHQWENDIPTEVSQGQQLGCPGEANALNAAWQDFYVYLRDTVQIFTINTSTSFDRNTFIAKSNAFAAAERALEAALQNRARTIAQDTGANMFLDPYFKNLSDTTAWAAVTAGQVFVQASPDGQRIFYQPNMPGETQLVCPRFVFFYNDRIDYEFEFFVEAGASNTRFGMYFTIFDGFGNGISGTGAIFDDNAPRNVWAKYVGSFKGSMFGSGNIGLVQPYLFSDTYGGAAAIYIRNPKAYRVVNALLNLNQDGRQASPLLTTSFAISASVSVTGLSITSSDTVIATSGFNINFGAGFTGIHAMAYGGLAPSTTYHIWLIAPNMNDAGSYLFISSSFTGNTDPNGIYIGYAQTQMAGGGTAPPPTTGGGGDSPSDCVCSDMLLFEDVRAGDVRAGDRIDLLALDHSGVEGGIVEAARLGWQRCVRLTSATGIEIDCSDSTPMERQDGTMFKAPDSLGELLFVDDRGEERWEACVAVRDIGHREVARISVGCRVYMAGRVADRRIATHNIRYDPKQ